MPWFPQLQSCVGAPTPCAREAIWDAFNALKTKLSAPCPPCDTAVFNKIGFGANAGDVLTVLNRNPLFTDGPNSHAPLYVLCGSWTGLRGILNSISGCSVPGPNGEKDLAQFFSNNPGLGAITQTPHEWWGGLVTFIDPAVIQLAPASSAGGILNQALVFHESLHSSFGIWDPFLLSDFGYNAFDSSCHVTDYLELKIWAGTLNACH
jgi:hypothetical protein